MSQPIPEGFVDPEDVSAVTTVLAAVVASSGTDGVADLLSRLPGVRYDPGRPAKRFSSGVPARIVIGTEYELVTDDPAELRQTVGGVVLHRTPVPRGELPRLLAPIIASLTRVEASYADTAAVLTAARDLAENY